MQVQSQPELFRELKARLVRVVSLSHNKNARGLDVAQWCVTVEQHRLLDSRNYQQQTRNKNNKARLGNAAYNLRTLEAEAGKSCV